MGKQYVTLTHTQALNTIAFNAWVSIINLDMLTAWL
jgi:hypothetical protein